MDHATDRPSTQDSERYVRAIGYQGDWYMALYLALQDRPVPTPLLLRILDVPAPADIADVVARSQSASAPDA